jgi:glycerol-3-phosphate acyltransferase PlsY
MRLDQIVLAIAGGYLLGAIPVGYLVGKAWGVDVLQHASGRTGGTNVWRATKQILPPLLTVLGDILKGMAAVLIGRYLLHSELLAALGGAAAVLGHNWSVFLGMRGGAGGMTAGAALTALSPLAAAFVVPLALLALYISHYASVGTLSVAAGGLLVLGALVLVDPVAHPALHLVFGFLSTVAVAIALRPNLRRLAEGKERRITLW